MKKKLCVLALVITLFSGCNIASFDTLNTNLSYKLTAAVKYGAGEETIIGLNRASAGVWEGTINDPFALQGYGIAYSKEMVTISFGGMSVQPSETSNTGIKLLLDALESGLGGGSAVKAGDSIEISGANQNGSYLITFDGKTLLPVSITVAEHGLTAVFSDVTASEFEAPIIADFAENAG